MDLVLDGKPRAEVVVAAQAPSIVRYAAGELQHYVERMSGAKLPVVTQPTPGTGHVFVGESPFTVELGLRIDGLKPDGYRVVCRDTWLALVGRDYRGKPWNSGAHPFRTAQTYNRELGLWAFGEAGSLFAVYDFLRSQGVRWYMPGDLGEVVPRRPTVAAASGERQVEPHYVYRNPYFCDFPRSASNARWFRRLGCGGPAPVFANHTMQRVLAGQAETHPQWFALFDGRRHLSKRGKYGYPPCLNGPGYADALVQWARRYFDSKPQEAMCAIMPPDSFRACECPACAAQLTPERGREGEHSDYVWRVVDYVARQVSQSHPGKKISCCAYARYLLPPARIERLSDNIVVVLCQSRAHMFDRAYRDKILDVRRQWKQKLPGGEFYVWEYYLANRYRLLYGLPAVFTGLIAEDLPSLRDFAQGEFVECNKGSNRCLADPLLNNLNIYLTTRLYWDPNADVAALAAEYYRLFFGPAAGAMQEFYQEAERIWMRPVPPKRRNHGGIKNLVKEHDVRRLFAILERARSEAKASPYRDRVELMIKDCAPLQSLYGRPPEGRPWLEVASIGKTPVAIDGKLDEPFWAGQPVHVLRHNRTGGPAHQPTRFRIVRSNTDLIIGVECDDPNVAQVPMKPRKPDSPALWEDDVVEVFLATPVNDCFQWGFNARGAWCDVNWADADGFAEGVTWNSGHRVAAAVHESGWTVEVAIPRRAIDPRGALRPTRQRPWRFNLYRTWQTPGGAMIYAGWSPTLKDRFRDSYMFGLLAFR